MWKMWRLWHMWNMWRLWHTWLLWHVTHDFCDNCDNVCLGIGLWTGARAWHNESFFSTRYASVQHDPTIPYEGRKGKALQGAKWHPKVPNNGPKFNASCVIVDEVVIKRSLIQGLHKRERELTSIIASTEAKYLVHQSMDSSSSSRRSSGLLEVWWSLFW